MGYLRFRIRLFLTILIAPFVFIAGCGTDENETSEFDASQINQHMEAEVSFDEQYRPQFHYTPKINWMTIQTALFTLMGPITSFINTIRLVTNGGT